MTEQEGTDGAKRLVVVGIDLGTTYSCIAHVDETNNAVTIKNSDGDLTTPSVVFFEGPDNVVVGETAKRAIFDADRVVSFMKVSMGNEDVRYVIDNITVSLSISRSSWVGRRRPPRRQFFPQPSTPRRCCRKLEINSDRISTVPITTMVASPLTPVKASPFLRN